MKQTERQRQRERERERTGGAERREESDLLSVIKYGFDE